MKYTTLFVLGLLAIGGLVHAEDGHKTGDTEVKNEAIFQTSGTSGESTSVKAGSDDDSDANTRAATNTPSGDPDFDLKKAFTLNAQPMGGDIKAHGGSQDSDQEDDDKSATSTSDDKNKNADQNDDNDEGEEHRSAVASFVAELHKIASSTAGGIGEKVREVAREQNDDNQDVSDRLSKVDKRSAFLRFLIGTDQSSLDVLMEAASTTKSHIEELEKIKLTAALDIQKSLDKEIKALTHELERIQKVIDKNKDVFSLFGWLVNLF